MRETPVVPRADVRSYYGQPVLKQPVWTWEIPCYFFTGGLAGASAGLAALAEARGNEQLGRRAWAASMAGAAASPALLISDLGKPTRFLNMMRVLKVTSPMSVGSWLLAATASAIGVAALNAHSGLLPGPARAARPAAALLGLPLSTYTAALISNTAVPVWHEARWTLPFLFASGAAASAGAAAVAVTPPASAAPARRLAIAGAVGEAAASRVMEHRLGDLGGPYREGPAATFGRAAKALTVAGAVALGAVGGRSRSGAVGGGVLLLAGALCQRWSVYKAGLASVSDPAYTVGPQRRRVNGVSM